MTRESPFRRKPPKLPRSPEGQVIADAVRRLTASDDFDIVIQHLKATAYEKFVTASAQVPLHAGALLEVAIRNTVIVELEQLGKRVTDDDRNDQRD